jgi:hypothetical protein
MPLYTPLYSSIRPCGRLYFLPSRLDKFFLPWPIIPFKTSVISPLAQLTISSFLALSARLDVPRLRPVFFKFSRAFWTHSMSLSLNSVEMISISRHGSTSPTTWVTSASSNARTTWKIPSTARTWDRKAFPRPSPVEAP